MKRILSLIYMFACMSSCSGEATKPDEVLTIQHIGQVDSGVEQMAGIGDTDVKFELIND